MSMWGIRVVILSVYDEPAVVEECLATGAVRAEAGSVDNVKLLTDRAQTGQNSYESNLFERCICRSKSPENR